MPPRILNNSSGRILTPQQNQQPQAQGAGDIFFKERGGVVSASGTAQETTAKQNAQKKVDLQFEQQQNATVQAVIDSLIASGKPLMNISPEELLGNQNIKNVGLTDVGKVKTILDSFKTDKQLQAQTSLQKALDELVYLSDQIPSSPGIYGRYLTSGFNNLQQSIGKLPQKDVFDANLKSSLATISRSFGEVGNLSEFDQKSYEKLLEQLGSPQIEVRKLARESISRRLGKDIGLKIKLSTPFEIKKKKDAEKNLVPQNSAPTQNDLSSVSTDDLLKQLGIN